MGIVKNMSPERAKVAIVDDDQTWHGHYENALSRAGHQVVIKTKSLLEGIAAIPQIISLEVDVALVDGRIPGDSQDGTNFTIALREAAPHIKVIDVSNSGRAVKGADARMGKMDFDRKGFGELITKL